MKRLQLIFTTVLLLLSHISVAQCDFVNDITGLTMGTPPAGDAADPTLYTHEYVLVGADGVIVATSSTPDFIGLSANLYYLYSINYENSEAGAIAPLAAVGSTIASLQSYVGCLDISGAFGNCSISVCDQISVLENSVVVNPATGFETTGFGEEYCLVCNNIVQDVNTTGIFDLSLYPAASAGANCQIISMNFQLPGSAPVVNGDTWTTTASGNCNVAQCWDYLARNLDITTILSVALTDFSGSIQDDFNAISWETSSETNSSHFVLQRSIDGFTFEPVYQTEGQGTTTEAHRYHYNDYAIEDEIVYYRLKSVDIDGSFQQSQIISLSRNDLNANNLVVYPVPADDFVQVSIPSAMAQKAQVELRSVDGKLITRTFVSCENGLNSLQLDLSTLAAGMYEVTVVLVEENQRYSARIVK